jgi:anti-anti-sigma factor
MVDGNLGQEPNMRIERGPDWLIVQLCPPDEPYDNMADRLWAVLNQHFVYRLVLEMDYVDFLPSQLIGQLVMLHKRVLKHGGALRLCGLSSECQEALHICRLDQALPNFPTRAEAVHGRELAKMF